MMGVDPTTTEEMKLVPHHSLQPQIIIVNEERLIFETHGLQTYCSTTVIH